jgi:hypothetical protein
MKIKAVAHNMTTQTGGFGILNQLCTTVSIIIGKNSRCRILTASRLPDALCVGVGSSQSTSRGRLESEDRTNLLTLIASSRAAQGGSPVNPIHSWLD